MNESLNRLANLSLKEHRIIIGLMSGTSLDGLDIALCRINGSGLSTKVTVLNYETIEYTGAFKNDLKSVFSNQQADLQKLTLLNAFTGTLHGEMINGFLKKHSINPRDVDCIASHGQTIYHAPKRLHKLVDYPNATLQIGDADHIAVKTGITVIGDFRQKHLAAGGEGAPLALYGDYILFSSTTENRILLNIGGISNFTYLPKTGNSEKVICTDAGPGNTLIDALCRKYFGLPYDSEGKLARGGIVNGAALSKMLQHPFFKEPLPKTTGPESFNIDFIERAAVHTAIDPISLIHTATLLTATSISETIKEAAGKNNGFTVYVSGGGAHNAFLLEKIAEQLPNVNINNMDTLGISADSKEAVLFALLANETICGSALDTGAGPKVMMGKISLAS